MQPKSAGCRGHDPVQSHQGCRTCAARDGDVKRVARTQREIELKREFGSLGKICRRWREHHAAVDYLVAKPRPCRSSLISTLSFS